jgi:hypothetical protein
MTRRHSREESTYQKASSKQRAANGADVFPAEHSLEYRDDRWREGILRLEPVESGNETAAGEDLISRNASSAAMAR